ncbi:transcriptional regulator GlxA family with amidase domain [Murinocardiopsis flavida]|uniref:Transcriptional regulator GlxA family with amidase domain n=1 Tax=Murinocardiopsis flavida TaxID=645275 RepID=A0A2P8DSN9_9ACTN|nr:helix-turn-helix domain-containing protein [Murinocardiopsis flavida]PSL00239.1 transcriptional regulator GlxA family with amidase domain [Murinocardiopsis flavida]
MAAFAHDGRHRVAVLVRHGLLPIEMGIVHRLFSQARPLTGSPPTGAPPTGTRSAGTPRTTAPPTTDPPVGDPLYEVLTCALAPGEIRTDADITINVAHGPELLAEADTVVVPASDEDYEPTVDGRPSAPLAEAFARIRPGTRVASICTGSFVLAAVGLLDGRRATTHWRSAEQFRALYPAVDLDPDVLYTDEGGVLTAAGVASGIDLCLHMIRCDHGAAVANEVARGTVVSPHREGGQAQFIRRPVPEPRMSSTGAAREWALRHLGRPLTLRELAAKEAMSVRTFTRRFREESGVSPVQWLTRERVERARLLLEETDMPVERVAAEVGFGTAVSLRQHLHAALGVSPSAYRATFRGPAGPPAGPASPVQPVAPAPYASSASD